MDGRGRWIRQREGFGSLHDPLRFTLFKIPWSGPAPRHPPLRAHARRRNLGSSVARVDGAKSSSVMIVVFGWLLRQPPRDHDHRRSTLEDRARATGLDQRVSAAKRALRSDVWVVLGQAG